MSRAYIFPGQGAQFQGMGKELYYSNSRAREMMEEANEILGFRITEMMFEGDEEDLKATEIAQPAIFLHSATLALCSEGLPEPALVGGHSLGEFSALVTAGAIDFENGLRLVKRRAESMKACCEKVPGVMAAVLSLPDDVVESICAKVPGVVVPANYNCDGQTVISGEKEAVKEACVLLKEAGARRALILAVAGAFHSPLMEPARAEFAKAVEAAPLHSPKCPVFQNVSALGETDPARIKDNLIKQLTAPVLWKQSVRNMLKDGADEFIELGPKTVLQGMFKHIDAARGTDIIIDGIQ